MGKHRKKSYWIVTYEDDKKVKRVLASPMFNKLDEAIKWVVDTVYLSCIPGGTVYYVRTTTIY